MKRQLINYETLVKVSKGISHSRDPEEVVLMTVESIKTALDVKGCALFLVNKKNNELELAASYGLSEEYLSKGPVSTLHSIAQSLEEGPVAIYDVTDDPRIQYPEEAKKEGISSILSVPIITRSKVIGCMRVYTSEHWEFTLDDVNFVHAIAQIAGMAIDSARLYKGHKESIDVLKSLREVHRALKARRTPYEGVPSSVPTEKLTRRAS